MRVEARQSVADGHRRLFWCMGIFSPLLRVTPARAGGHLWEIDENLIRAELTELERGQHLKRRKEIFRARQPIDLDQGTARSCGA